MIKNKIVVGIIPTYNLTNEDNDPYLDRAYYVRMYEEMIKECGVIPIGLLDEDISIYLDMCDAYLWPGGSKILWNCYPVIDDALKNHKPILGICLGMQAITTYFNILDDSKKSGLSFKETYDLNKESNPYLKKLDENKVKNHSNYVTKDIDSIENAKHKIIINENSILKSIYNTSEINVASMHGLEVARTCQDLFVSAKSEDGVIEAIEYSKESNHILGIQYHPELIKDKKVFEWLINNSYDKYNILVNKDNEIPNNIKFNIITYDSKYPHIDKRESLMEEQTYYAFLKLKNKMKELGHILDLESGFRYSEDQEELFERIKEEKGINHANMYVAKPRHSEHETGLALDVCGYVDGKWCLELDNHLDSFYVDLHKVIADYGFILRYPKDKENITGYAYEPWHIRYVGSIKLAKYIMDNNLTLEEIQ